jgi:hypothetical protein
MGFFGSMYDDDAASCSHVVLSSTKKVFIAFWIRKRGDSTELESWRVFDRNDLNCNDSASALSA